jgi:putative ABC transport system permease protein
MNYLGLIWKNALRNRRRSLLTIASIAASFCLLGVLASIYNALFITNEVAPAGARRLVTRNRISLAQVMPSSYKQKILTVPGVQSVMATQWFGGVYKEPKNFFARFACEPEEIFKVQPQFQLPDEQKKAFQQDQAGTMIGSAIAKKFNLKLGDKMTLKGEIFPVDLEFTVRAIYDDPISDEVMWFHFKYLRESLPEGRRDFAGTFTILTESAEAGPGIAQQIDAMFRNSFEQTRTESESAFQASFVSFLGNVKLYLIMICSAITFTILLVCANTIAMSVRERVREVGILKTLGFTNGEVLNLILGEASVISLVGGSIGCLIASVLVKGVAAAGGSIAATIKTMRLEPQVALAVVGLAVVVGLISALIPAASAARTTIVDAMKYTG